jgi:hypothetical protein
MDVRKSRIQKEPDEELLRKKELDEKARKRTRGPYRKSSRTQVPARAQKS